VYRFGKKARAAAQAGRKHWMILHKIGLGYSGMNTPLIFKRNNYTIAFKLKIGEISHYEKKQA